MSFPIRQIAVLALFLCLTACPGRQMGMRLSSEALPGGGRELRIRSVIIDMTRGEKPPGWSRETPLRFYQPNIGISSGGTDVWRIERMPEGANCPWDEVPSQIRYGETPVCYTEVIAAQPLVPGRAYGGPGGFFVYNEDGSIKRISPRAYAARTRRARSRS